MQFLSFTPQETKALIFLLTALLVGSGITLYKKTHPQFAPELVVEKSQPFTVKSPQTGDPLNEKEVKKKINLNQAKAGDLVLLPGLGPELSRRIIEYREANGPFQKIEDLMQVPGIGLKRFEQIKDYLTIK
jgi:competence protein ComEA